jgi:hypothetical protein
LGELIGFFMLDGGSSSFEITQLGVDLPIQSTSPVFLCLKVFSSMMSIRNLKFNEKINNNAFTKKS